MKLFKQIVATLVTTFICISLLYAPYWLLSPEAFWERLVTILLIVLFIASWVIPIGFGAWVFVMGWIDEEW